jgi:hypothetical protein
MDSSAHSKSWVADQGLTYWVQNAPRSAKAMISGRCDGRAEQYERFAENQRKRNPTATDGGIIHRFESGSIVVGALTTSGLISLYAYRVLHNVVGRYGPASLVGCDRSRPRIRQPEPRYSECYSPARVRFIVILPFRGSGILLSVLSDTSIQDYRYEYPTPVSFLPPLKVSFFRDVNDRFTPPKVRLFRELTEEATRKVNVFRDVAKLKQV